MDVNWYLPEKIAREELRGRVTRAEVGSLAGAAQRHRTRRLVGAALVELGRMLLGESSSSVSGGTPSRGTLVPASAQGSQSE